MKPQKGLIDFSIGVFAGLLFLAVLFALMGAVISSTAGAQEKDPSYPRSWRMKSGPSFLDLDVDIIETAGVCLYLVKSGGVYGGYTIAAVAKTQLPRGVGCQ
jgi:hypothetical protein